MLELTDDGLAAADESLVPRLAEISRLFDELSPTARTALRGPLPRSSRRWSPAATAARDARTMTSDGGRTAELLVALIRNACVNDGTDDSGNERRNAEVLAGGAAPALFEWHHPAGPPGAGLVVARLDGTDPAAPTLLLLGHTDVVPVNPARWPRDPFGGEIVDGEVWGRGAVDMLNQTAAMALAFDDLAAGPPGCRARWSSPPWPTRRPAATTACCTSSTHDPELLRCDAALTEAGGTVMPTAARPGARRGGRREGDGADAHRRARPRRATGRRRGRRQRRSSPRPRWSGGSTGSAADRTSATTGGDWVEATVDDPALRARLLDVERPAGTTSTTLPARRRVHAHACTHTTYTPTIVSAGLKSNIVPDEIAARARRPRRARRDDRRRRALPRRAARRPPRDDHGVHRTEPTRSTASAPIWPALRAGRAARPTPAAAWPRRCSPAPPTAATCGALGVPVFGFGVLSAALDPATYWSRFHGDDERIDIESLALSTAAWEHVARDLLG